MELKVSQGTELRVAVQPVADQALPVTWVGEVHLHFTPNVDLLRLHASRVVTLGSSWDLGSQVLDVGMPADWIFPLRECNYGLLTIFCPNKPHPVLVEEYGSEYMTPDMCHHCDAEADQRRHQNMKNSWEEIMAAALGQNLEGNVISVGADELGGSGGIGLKVNAMW